MTMTTQQQTRAVRRRMTSVPKQVSEEAAGVGFGTFIATCITGVFVAFGWIFGSLWFAVRYCAVAVRYGYRQGAHVPRAPQHPAPGRGGPDGLNKQ
jgi:hypothetical protein